MCITRWPKVGNATDYKLNFWPGFNSERDQRIVSVDEGPCGSIATARVKSMPAYSKNSPLIPERVLQLNSSFHTTRSWRIPVDAIPQGIAGNILYFLFEDSVYEVLPNGKLKRPSSMPVFDPPVSVSCVIPSAFDGSDYAGCWQYTDLRSGQKKILAFLSVCS